MAAARGQQPCHGSRRLCNQDSHRLCNQYHSSADQPPVMPANGACLGLHV
jgi:hypothetical protein